MARATSRFNTSFSVAANVTATLNCPVLNNSSAVWNIGSNSVLNLGGGSSGGQAITGVSQAVSTMNITSNIYTQSATLDLNGLTFNVQSNGIVADQSRLDIGRNAAATMNVFGGGILAVNSTGGNNAGNQFQMSRGNPGILNVFPGALVGSVGNNSGPAGKLQLVPDSTSRGIINISGGIFNVGSGTNGTPGFANSVMQPIEILAGANNYANTSSGVINLSGGILTAKSMLFGSSSGTYANNPTNPLNMTGGALYLDVPNIVNAGKSTGTNFGINLSGGIVGATANWSPAASLPMTLGTVNGDITFQASDSQGTAFNMAIAGILSGPGGMKKTGGGTLTLSGANTYAGTTAVSNGTLVVSTAGLPTNGPVIVDGTTATVGPVLSILVANVAQSWAIGTLTYAAGSPNLGTPPTADFSFNFSPSTTVAPIQITGDLVFTVTPSVTVEGNNIATGQYPLWHYTGNLSGTAPNAIVNLPPFANSAYITNNPANHSVDLVVNSSLQPKLIWAGTSGQPWDINITKDWKRLGSSAFYTEPDTNGVQFDDTDANPFPMTVALNTVVNPASVTVNSTNVYTISGAGSISGSTALIKDGTGTLTLSGTNTYSGGTTLNTGQLNLNNGGDGVSSSAVGTGLLTIALGSKIDNTSGHAITLVTPVPEMWNDDFTFVGSANLTLGSGQITLGSGQVAINVVSNTLEVDGPITDNGATFGIAKDGAGTLTLSNNNSFAGGMNLRAGQLNINSEGAVGTGLFTISGGSVIDNTSGAPVTLSTPIQQSWAGNWTFKGTTNLDFSVASIVFPENMTLTVNSNILSTEAALVGANKGVTKAGPGTWTIGGGASDTALGITVNGGTINFNKDVGGNVINFNQLTINSNATVFIMNATGTQMGASTPVVLGGGRWT